MSFVNIIREDYFLRCGPKLLGEIKKSCHDFEVREIHSEPRRPVSCMKPSNCLHLNESEAKSESQSSSVNGTLVEEESGSEVMDLESIIGSAAIGHIANVSANYRDTLHSIHDGHEVLQSAFIPKVAVLLRREMSKRQRGFVHDAIKESFPFLKTAAMSAEECIHQLRSSHLSKSHEVTLQSACFSEEVLESVEIEDDNDEVTPDEKWVQRGVSGVWVSADESLLELASTTLSLHDIAAIYAFKVRGPHHPNASTGVLVGLGLSRDERTRVYRVVTSKCLSLDSKTIEDRKHKKHGHKKRHAQYRGTSDVADNADVDDSKSMLIFWRKKSSFMKGKAAKDSGVPQSECGSSSGSSSESLHVEFTLCKVNTEHLAALQLIAAAASAAIGDLSFCGIKDKKAVTYQQCVLTIRTYSMEKSTGEDSDESSFSAIALECLKSVTDSALRVRAGAAIDSLLLAFPPDNPVRLSKHIRLR